MINQAIKDQLDQALISQELLFDKTPLITPAKNKRYHIPSSFYAKGYSLLGSFPSAEQAYQHLFTFIEHLSIEETAFAPESLQRMQLAKVDAIPLCHEITSTGFQALHWDMGQPFFNEQPQTLYTIGALYRPLGDRNSNAKTRMVSLSPLLNQKSFGSKEEVKEKLLAYVKEHGDGWMKPTPVNTHRLACFARVLDALTNQKALCHEIDTMIGQCFTYDTSASGTKGFEEEIAFFKDAGVDLNNVEEQIEILPGQMLVYDNMRTVHGRIGKREPKELINFLFGIKEAKEIDIATFSNWIFDQAN